MSFMRIKADNSFGIFLNTMKEALTNAKEAFDNIPKKGAEVDDSMEASDVTMDTSEEVSTRRRPTGMCCVLNRECRKCLMKSPTKTIVTDFVRDR